MSERSNGKKNAAPTTLDLLGDDEPAKPRAARKPAPVAAPFTAPEPEAGGALFGGEDVDLDAKHPADVPVGNFPAPSQIAQAAEVDPFGEEDPFEDSVMARMLADEPAPIASPLRAAREDFQASAEAAPVAEPEPVTEPELLTEPEPVAEIEEEPMTEAGPDLDAFADPVAAPEVEQVIEPPIVGAAAEPISEPVVEALPEPIADSIPEPIAEVAPEPQPELLAAPEPTPAPAPAKKAKAAPALADKPAPGLTFERRYTEAGQDVWATAEWELRTASIVGSDGKVVFEQSGVEIPKAWSQLATNVVVSKYFRGQIGTLEREYSVKQLIGRVADRILEWGREGHYFASDADADVFHDELRYILLHQHAAFNSPVWFNLGWAGRRQAVSACYITEVNDTMESILDLYKTEGMLFKDGSGCTSGDSLVHVRDEGFLPIRNLYKKFFAEGRSVHDFDGKGRYIEVGDADVHTLSINPDTGVFGQDQVLRVWQYDLPQEDKLTVRLDTGAKATVSCWHPFLVWDGEKITHRRADQLRRGDAVLGPNATARAAVRTQPTTFEYETTYFDRREMHTIALDEDVAWLCGYFMGDGSLGARQGRVKTTSGRLCTYDGLRLRFYDETAETLMRVQQVIERVFGEQVKLSQGASCLTLSYTGRRVTRFFEQLFGAGSKTYSLSMPAFVWNSPRPVQLAFLGGLIDSDGYVAEGGRAKYSSASREFAGEVAALASFLGLGGGTVLDRHVTTATVLHRVASATQREEFAAYLSHPERRRLLETNSNKPQRKFCLPLGESVAHDLFGSDRAPADWLKVPIGGSTFHLGRLKYGGLINPLKLQKALTALDRDDDLTRRLTQVAESAAFVFSVEPCAEDPDFYDLTVRDHNNYLAGETGLVVIHNSGQNLSALRSSKEPLAAGGRSSGPIAFMKGLDASAGSIKSGGSTRRAAKMVILDADHPDIQEFVDCKKDAELKAHALIDAGYSGAFNVANGAYDTVPFQNANHSVRVTDQFMQAVEADGPWDTKFRTNGETAETLRAKDLLHSIAEGTWTCGDPGMQFDTISNDWHTCANTDRIYASNPCCFVGETLVETAEGQIPFASLFARHEAGEDLPTVFSFDRVSRLPALQAINKVWIAGYTRDLVEVKTERGQTFRCTPEHRFLTQSGEYVEARHLVAGTVLCSLRCAAKDLPENREALAATLAEAADVLLSVTPLTLDVPVPVYDMEVQDTHNFAITDGHSAGLLSIVVSNSEFFFLNSTACNLSSLNLMKFREVGSGAFDTASFEHAVKIMITAQEMMVGFAHYPTEKITQRSHEYRPLGLGYANLGALLMAAGLPYDSDAGRAYAGAVTSLMTGRAYHQSAQVARDCGGPFAGYDHNREPMLRVMGKHRAAVDDIDAALIPETLLDAARTAWDETVALGELHGYRNAQATVLAPTGTIGFLMDCDTTGIEPDIAIVKYKSLVGGGMMKIVNQTVPEALERLGYSEAERQSIIAFIDEHDTIEGATDLKPEHLPIFDCAFRPMNGTRSIHYRGHIKMMAAAQPFISGAISKTVNLPNSATPDDIAETYQESWKLGIKAVAIYRDGSKRTQPLNTGKETPAADKVAEVNEAAPAALTPAVPKAVRRRLPNERDGVTHKFSIGGHEGYLTVGLYPDTRQPGEIFIRMSKEGSSISGLMDSFATAISLALQYGVPLQTLVDKFIHSRFEPSGFTGNKEIPMAKSVMDYIFRYLALRFLQAEDRHNVGLLADQPADDAYPAHDTNSGTLSNGNGVKNGNGTADLSHLADTRTATLTEHEREIYRAQSDAPPCPECGAITIRNGACYRCVSCGTSLGCS